MGNRPHSIISFILTEAQPFINYLIDGREWIKERIEWGAIASKENISL